MFKQAIPPLLLSVLLLVSTNTLADAGNYNPNAAGNANSNGVNNANCNSALILSCDPTSAAPAPAIGGGVSLIAAALIGLYLRRRK